MANASEAKSRVKISVLIGDLIQRNRKVLVIVVVAVIVVFTAIAGGVMVMDTLDEKAIVKAEGFAESYDVIRNEADETKKASGSVDLIASLNAFSASARGYAKARSFAVLATVHSDRKEWKEAEAAWLASSAALPKSYLAPVGVYNAAACAEEAGETDNALALYQRCADEYGKEFALAGRALFAVGRINEQSNNQAAAIAAYQKIIDTWANDENWTKLANSRIIFLSSHS
ncbi:MAG: hypothetical protein A2Z99_04130 [Treponema sp. GWB1_62_6]|nr:MAG: hypothetical protein A2Y36_13445 [Treponema sp. GWA1_62_8]OHE71140.1 MAG: hypothetical protein A2413_16880 [Treponema sp. RIFOXYC1_FULL_61_9]OHE71481.1 MAG: hypothetical protein A2Z99_04130 [Treponema sp. GWB1_62_6]